VEEWIREKGPSGYLAMLEGIDEVKLIEENRDFLQKELSLSEIVVYKGDDPKVEDPADRARLAEPLRPSFLLE